MSDRAAEVGSYIGSVPFIVEGDGIRLVGDEWRPSSPARGSVVLLHGGGQTRHSWHRTGAMLAANGWHAVAVDARGHGESEWDAGGDYSSRAQMDDLRRVVRRTGNEPVLVGASMGGITALNLVAAEPEIASGLVLVDVTPRLELEGLRDVVTFMSSGADGFATIDEAAQAVVAYNPGRRHPPRPEALARNLRSSGSRFYWHWDPRLLDVSDLDEFATRTHETLLWAAERVTVPTLVVRGTRSRVVSSDGVDEVLRVIRGSRVVEVSGAGHMVAGDDNAGFSGELVGFLDGLVREGLGNP